MIKTFSSILFLFIASAMTCQAQLKMSSLVRKTMHEVQHISAAKGHRMPERRMNAFVRTDDVDVLRSNGCRVLASFGDIHIASIPIGSLQTLAHHDAIKRIEAGRRCMVQNDSAAIMVGIRSVSPAEGVGSDYPLTGKGVVMGIMDIGFDLTHPTFYSAGGDRYRIKAMWDQLDRGNGGNPVLGTDTTYLGRQYVGKEALLALGHSYDGYGFTHGTHTTGSAAGSGWDGKSVTPYAGMAPEADICLVANYGGDNQDSIPKKDLYLYNSTLDMLGFKYIFDYAEAHGQPCVISFSEGSYVCFDDDDRLYCEALSRLLGPGRILCASAGNEAYKNSYVNKPVGKAKAGAFIAQCSGEAYYVMRSSAKTTLRLTFYSKSGSPVVRDYHTDQCLLINDDDKLFTDTLSIDGTEHVVILASYPSAYNDKEWSTEIGVVRPDGGSVSADIPVSLTLMGEDVQVELYGYSGYFTSNFRDPELRDYDNTHNILNPGAYSDIICVGSTDTRWYFHSLSGDEKCVKWGEKGMHSSFSSIGPAPNGDIKPDVTAPGSMVISAHSSYHHEKNTFSWDVSEFEWNGRKYVWSADCGTSMSSPVAAGVIATWLEECPTLSTQQVMETIAATSIKPQDFRDYGFVTDERGFTKNNVYGYGIIDAKSGLEYIRRNFTGIDELQLDANADGMTYDIMGRRVATMHPGKIYIRNGKKIILR